MSGLIIEHGDPWWLSPNVWVVPASDPSEPSPGTVAPVAGRRYYPIANVRNTSAKTVADARVYFWWASAALGMLTSANAEPIGVSSVTVSAGHTATALALTPWIPSFVNGGHECLVAAVVEAGGSPPTVFDADSDPTVAQHNLGVVRVAPRMHGRFHYPFEVWNTKRIPESFSVAVRQAPLAKLDAFLGGELAERAAAAPHGPVAELGFLRSLCPDPSEHPDAKPKLEALKLPPFGGMGFSLVGRVEDGGAALLHVTQSIGRRIVGGLSVLIVEDSREGAE